MSFIDWTEEESVKVDTIDTQHKELAGLFNSLYGDVSDLKEKDILKDFDKILEYLEIHFGTEESLMKQYHFPGYISHKLEHDRFYNQILRTADKYKQQKINFGLEDMKSIRRWFFNHIEINDKKCGVFLAEKGVV